MSDVVIVGAQWGDEGKGKIVDHFSKDMDLVIRDAGGANAGHTLVVNGEKTVLHLIPSGILYPHVVCLLGAGMVICLETLLREMTELAVRGVGVTTDRLKIALGAHLVLPTHKMLDAAYEKQRGKQSIGTTNRGIGPAYTDKALRRGVRVGEMLDPDAFYLLVGELMNTHVQQLKQMGSVLTSVEMLQLSEFLESTREIAKTLQPHLVDGSEFMATAQDQRKRMLVEGAQGVLLDIDSGTFPYATSSKTIATGLRHYLGHNARIVGVCKAYTTKVGAGPFPTKMETDLADVLRKAGGEYGATTGRNRDCGWLDLVALRYAIRVAGITELALTKIDILSGWDEVNLCVAYRHGNDTIHHFPAERGAKYLSKCEPVYQPMEGWVMEPGDKHLPIAANDYIRFIEHFVGIPISLIGTGPERHQIIAC